MRIQNVDILALTNAISEADEVYAIGFKIATYRKMKMVFLLKSKFLKMNIGFQWNLKILNSI